MTGYSVVKQISIVNSAVEEMPQLSYLRGPDLSGACRRTYRVSEPRNH
jgi:hypothetical protein